MTQQATDADRTVSIDATPAQPHDAPEPEDGIVDGDAATHLEALVSLAVAPARPTAGAEGLPIELVGQHLRLSGTVIIGFHRRLSDFVNNHDGLIQIRDVTVLRRNGDPTKVTSPSFWVSPEEVTLIGQATDVDERETGGPEFMRKRSFQLIIVTPGHTLTGEVHLNPEAMLGGVHRVAQPAVDPAHRCADPFAGRPARDLQVRLRARQPAPHRGHDRAPARHGAGAQRSLSRPIAGPGFSATGCPRSAGRLEA